LENIK
jgi:hypothetical protein